MARMTEVKFGDLQVDERYRKLQRDLKLTLLKNKNEQSDKSIPSSLPHISGININFVNSNTSTPISHTSRVDNDVVSSSKNLSSMVPNNRFWRQNDCKKDCHTMQPPSSYIIPRTSKKLKSTVTHHRNSLPLSENKYNSSYMEFNRRELSFIPSDILQQCTDTISSMQSDSDNVQSKKAEVFIRWKVMLTEQGQLVIKGRLQCENKIVQSKPVIRRLTSTSVESVAKDLYHLKGNIVDDEYELPEYVKGKFYNGFPDDWENVHQIWRTFVEQGCKVSFRWPAPIADSDDDLKSEVTDVTYMYSENSNRRVSDLGSPKKSQTLGMLPNSDYSFDVSQRENDKTFTVQSCMKRDSCTQTSICGIAENSFYNVDIQSPLNQYGCDAECARKREGMNLKCSKDKDKDKLKSKVNIILNNLLDKDCSKKCITEIIKIVECFNHAVSNKSIEDNESSMEELNPDNYRNEQSGEISSDFEKLQSISMIKEAQYNKNTCSNSIDRLKYAARVEDNIASNNITDGGKSLPRKRTFTEMNKDNDSFESENEIYTGVPKIPVELLQRRREGLTKPYRRKIKKMAHQECNVTNKQRFSNVFSAENSVHETSSKHTNNIHLNDSDVTKYERCFSKTKTRDINPNIPNEIDKSVDYNIDDKEERWSGLNDLNKDKNMHEAQKCFLRENPTPIERSMNNFNNSFGRMKNYEFGSTPTENYTKTITNSNGRETIREVNSNIKETSTEANFSYQLKNNDRKAVKPAIISSVPVNIDIQELGLKNSLRKPGSSIVIKNENKNIKELNKENKDNSSMQNKSPGKYRVTARNANSTLLSDSKKNIEKHVQLGSVDSTSSKMSTPANLEMFKNNEQDLSYCKPKLLTAWVPKVLCESELSLIFEGTLLNDAGHVVRKKFQTDSILRRISPKLVETIHHEFYQLIGDVNDTKHVIPKQLRNKCRQGCPFKIDQFCETWKTLKTNNHTNSIDTMEKLDDTSVNTVNIGVSSKGRRLMRPLSYWTGERIMLKDNNLVYSPGTLQESFDQNKLAKTIGTPGNNDRMRSSSDESEDKEKPVNKSKSNTKQIATRSKSKQLLTNHNGRTDVRGEESDHSSDSENFSPSKKYRGKTAKQRRFDPVSVTTKQDAHSTGVEKSPEPYTRLDETKLVKKSTKTNENTGLNGSKRKSGNQEFSAGKYRDVVCTYFQDVPFKDDILSEDQESHV